MVCYRCSECLALQVEQSEAHALQVLSAFHALHLASSLTAVWTSALLAP